MAEISPTGAYPVDRRNRARRKPERAQYDVAGVHALLDAAIFCHIAYVVEGQPYCTPTTFWREGNSLLWHGSAASRMLRKQGEGSDICLTVTLVDSLVLTRSAFGHSANYRSVMVFGRAELVADPQERQRAANAFLDHLFPGRSKLVRGLTHSELQQTSFLRMDIEQATLKVRDLPASHEAEEHRDVPVWAGEIPLSTLAGPPRPCATLNSDVTLGQDVAAYAAGGQLDIIRMKMR